MPGNLVQPSKCKRGRSGYWQRICESNVHSTTLHIVPMFFIGLYPALLSTPIPQRFGDVVKSPPIHASSSAAASLPLEAAFPSAFKEIISRRGDQAGLIKLPTGSRLTFVNRTVTFVRRRGAMQLLAAFRGDQSSDTSNPMDPCSLSSFLTHGQTPWFSRFGRSIESLSHLTFVEFSIHMVRFGYAQPCLLCPRSRVSSVLMR